MPARGRYIVAVIGALMVAACGGSAVVSVASATPTATPTDSATAAAASGAAWTVTDKSKATIRVREQLVGVSLPSDALLTATGAKGSFTLNADGTFASGSKITFDLTTLASDERDRDKFIKNDTLPVRQRSEERRVGKECRSRWWPYDERKERTGSEQQIRM